MKKVVSILWLAGAIILSLGGVAGFIILFAPDMNVFWIILSPIIIAVYQIPAVVVYSLWKKRYKKNTQTPSSQK
jgi:ABC-type multidrug transport system permease subunit